MAMPLAFGSWICDYKHGLHLIQAQIEMALTWVGFALRVVPHAVRPVRWEYFPVA